MGEGEVKKLDSDSEATDNIAASQAPLMDHLIELRSR